MSGTVLADTNVFARQFDQQQWAHAFGLQLHPRRAMAKNKQDSYNAAPVVVQTRPRLADNSYASSR